MLTINLGKVELVKELKLRSLQQLKHTKECLVKRKRSNMKHLKLFEDFENMYELSNEEYNVLCMIGDIQHDEEEGVSTESFDEDELEIVMGLIKRGLVEHNNDLYVVTEKGREILDGDLNESKTNVDTALKNKSKDSGIPVGILRKVYSKGMQAWNAGHRPGVAQHQWGMGRVNSFITGSGGARKADAELWKKAKAAKSKKKK